MATDNADYVWLEIWCAWESAWRQICCDVNGGLWPPSQGVCLQQELEYLYGYPTRTIL